METQTQVDDGWRLDIVNASFLTGIPILAAIGMVWYTMNHGVSIAELSIFGFMYIACGLSIQQAITAYFLTGPTKARGHFVCSMHCLEPVRSKILPSSGAAITDVITLSPIQMTTRTQC